MQEVPRDDLGRRVTRLEERLDGLDQRLAAERADGERRRRQGRWIRIGILLAAVLAYAFYLHWISRVF